MHRRAFIAATAGIAGTLATVHPTFAWQATPAAAGLPRLEIAVTDAGLELPDGIQAGRYEFAAINTGSIVTSHFGIGKFPDDVTEADIEAFFAAQGEDTEALELRRHQLRRRGGLAATRWTGRDRGGRSPAWPVHRVHAARRPDAGPVHGRGRVWDLSTNRRPTSRSASTR